MEMSSIVNLPNVMPSIVEYPMEMSCIVNFPREMPSIVDFQKRLQGQFNVSNHYVHRFIKLLTELGTDVSKICHTLLRDMCVVSCYLKVLTEGNKYLYIFNGQL